MFNTRPKTSALVAGILLVLVFPQLFGLVLHFNTQPDVSRLLWSRLVYCTDAVLAIAYARYIERQLVLPWAESRQPFSFYLKWVVLLYLFALAAGILSYIPIKLGVPDNNRQMIYWSNIIAGNWWLIVFCSVTAGLTEELLIRGYIQTRLAQLFDNQYVHIVVSALLFSAMHYGYFSWRETIFTFLFGLGFAWHYWRYRNIKVLMLVHILVDMLSFTIWRLYHLHPQHMHGS